MSVTVRVPTILGNLAGGAAEVRVDGATLGDVISALDASHPGTAARVLDKTGRLRRFVNVYVDDEDVRFAGGLEAPVKDDSTVTILPAVAGGTVLPAVAGGTG